MEGHDINITFQEFVMTVK